jgi:putative Mg2+ transporter-C (MgtC) family protein
VTAIGMCAGAGMFVASAAVTFMGIVALTVLRRFEDKDDHLLRRSVSVVLGEDGHDIAAVAESLKKLGAKVSDVEYEKRMDDDKKHIVATLDVQFPDTIGVPQLIEAIETVPGVRRIVVQHHGKHR